MAGNHHQGLWPGRAEPLVDTSTPLMVLAIILIAGHLFSRLAERLKLPAVTGQIFAGVVLGPYGIYLFHHHAYDAFGPITNFALGFIGLTIGGHVDLHRLHNAGRRILSITAADALITPLLVFAALHWIASTPLPVTLIVTAIALTTDPGSIIHVVKEERAKGAFTKTLLAVVALNNVLTILLFYTAYYYLFYRDAAGTWFALAIAPVALLLESIATGAIVGGVVIVVTERRSLGLSVMSVVMLAVVVTVGVSDTFHYSGLLSCLILGIVITNFSNQRTRLFNAFDDLEKEVFSLFFVLGGTHLDFGAMLQASRAGGVLVLSRMAAKTAAPYLGARIAGATAAIRCWSGLAMYPLAGVAIGLVLICENNTFLQAHAAEITAIVLSAVIVNEILGPIGTGIAIRKAGDAHKDRVRLMDFLQEEFIHTELQAADKWDALNQLAEFLHRTHRCRDIPLADLKQAVINREREFSTGIGDQIAIPHAIVEGGPKIRGVIGISRSGIEFDAVDDRPVHIIVLIVTPKKHHDLHLHVLANIAKIFGHHPHIKHRLIRSRSPEEVFHLLQAEEIQELNPFFED